MLEDAAALEKAGARHVTLYPQRPTIEETLEVIQRFGEEVVRESMIKDIETAPLDELMARAAAKRDAAHGRLVSYSRKVFIPLTKLCRDVCDYCTFADGRARDGRPYLSPEAVLAIARAGAAAGCTEALFTLGDKPELRYRAAREALAALGTQQHHRLPARRCARWWRRDGPASARESRA